MLIFLLIFPLFLIIALKYPNRKSRSQWLRGLKCGSAAARLLGLHVRIPPWTWMDVVSVVCCQTEVSAAGWSLVLRSPIGCGVSECDHEASMRKAWPTGTCWITDERITQCTHILVWTLPPIRYQGKMSQITAEYTPLPFFEKQGVTKVLLVLLGLNARWQTSFSLNPYPANVDKMAGYYQC